MQLNAHAISFGVRITKSECYSLECARDAIQCACYALECATKNEIAHQIERKIFSKVNSRVVFYSTLNSGLTFENLKIERSLI